MRHVTDGQERWGKHECSLRIDAGAKRGDGVEGTRDDGRVLFDSAQL